MASEQSMLMAIRQAMCEATKVAIMAARKAEIPNNATRPAQTIPKTGSPVLKQPKFDWKSPVKYIKLWTWNKKTYF